jgi:glycosyltransferase involved in cell wall biosynthesis
VVNLAARREKHHTNVTALRAAFVVEQTLGHVTHTQNLRAAAERQSNVQVTWMPIPFEVRGAERFVPGFRGNWSVRASYRARMLLAQEHARRRFDVLFFHTQVTALFSLGLMRRVPTIISLDATPKNFDSVGPAYGHRPAGDGWLDSRKYKLNKDAFAAARALVAWSQWAADSLVADYGVPRERIVVTAPGASAEYFAIGARRVVGAHSDGPVRLLFVGGDFVRKGGFLLLEAIRAARPRRAVELHVVTRDAVPPTQGVIVHHGIGPNSPELFALFAAADVFVLPTLGECLSVALMEAAAAGLPIISTNVGALSEAALDGQSALVVRPGEPRSLRIALERIVDDDALRASLGRGAYALATGMFDAGRNNQTILELVASVAHPFPERSVA